MSWVAVAVGGGALLGYVGTQQTNSANARNSRGAGEVNVTTTRNPMDGTLGQRSDATEAAYEALFGHPSGQNELGGNSGPNNQSVGTSGVNVITPGVLPGAGGRGTGGGSKRGPSTWTNAKGQAMMLDAHGRAVPAPAGSGGAAAGGGAPAGPNLNNTSAPGGGKFNGISQYTQDAENALRALPGQEAGMYGTGQNYVEQTLQGHDQNYLRDDAVSAGKDIANDPELAAYEAALRGEVGGGAATGGTNGSGGGPIWTGAPAGGTGGWSSGGGGGLSSTYASSTGADAAIRDTLAGKATAGQTAAEDAIRAQVERGRASNIRDLRARAVGSGFYGGDVYQSLEEGAIAQGDQATAEQIAASRFGAYQNAMGLGTQYDLGMADVAAREHATSAGSASSAAALAQQGKLAQLGMWGDAIRTGQAGRAGTASALGSLAGQVSSDQQAGLAGIGELAGNRRADLTAAGDLSRDSDQTRTSYGVGMAGANASRSVGMANVTLGQQQLAFQQQQFNDPLNRISAFSNALNGLTGAYGSETTQGMDRRSQSPAPYQNPYGAALTGAAIGGQTASGFR